MIATGLFVDAVPYFQRGVIAAPVYQHPYLQGQTPVRLLADHSLQGAPMPKAKAYYLNPPIVLKANLALFRGIAG